MTRTVAMAGKRFGRLEVLSRNGSDSEGKAMWYCRCSCGAGVTVRGKELRGGRTRSCGCLRDDTNTARLTTHGQTRGGSTQLYWVWSAMLQRCENPRCESYGDYGARGISVAPEWRDFAVFSRDMGERPEGMTLERRDNDGPYAKWNCEWATRVEQRHNRRKANI